MTPQPSKPDGYILWDIDPEYSYDWVINSTIENAQLRRRYLDCPDAVIRPVWLSTEPLERLKAIEEWAKELLTKQRKPPQRIALPELQLEMVLIELEKILGGGDGNTK